MKLTVVVKNILIRVKKITQSLLYGLLALAKGFYSWLANVSKALLNLWCSLGPFWLRVMAVVVLVGFVGVQKLAIFLKPNLTEENIYSVRYLNGGWTKSERESFYYTPQGTELLGLRYDWLVNLELPMSHELFATEENMRGWGFIVDPDQRVSAINPGNLPVGLGQHIDPRDGESYLDIGCATCHTGELHYKGVALRVDGGQAVQSIPNAKRGEFITTLGASVFETLINPSKWNRFANRLVGNDKQKRKTLKHDLWQYLGNLKSFTSGAGASKYYPVEEGRGRTDAVGRIGNVVFGYDLDEPGNYRVADAPASYPFLWDIWRFDWVQYTGFTNQAMARNVGESLGVLAPIKLVDKDGNLLKGEGFGKSLVDVDGLHCAEGLLRKLEPPSWPEDVLGKIDIVKAIKGKELFADKCAYCHGPHVSEPYSWEVASSPDATIKGQINVNWKWDMAGDVSNDEGVLVRQDWREKIWSVPWIDVNVIGTDPKLADNYMDHKYDATKLVPGSEPVNAGDGLQVLLNILVPDMYERWGVSKDDVANYDGLNIPFRIENKRAYKARPLHGIWATPPFLHNGSVPTIYHMLSPLRERPKTFYVGNREYDPEKLGYVGKRGPGNFKHDTTIKGNQNIGHLFTDLQVPGRIGYLLSEAQKFALIEYLKVMGNPTFNDALGGDPQNWAKHFEPPVDSWDKQACANSRLRHELGFNSVKSGDDL